MVIEYTELTEPTDTDVFEINLLLRACNRGADMIGLQQLKDLIESCVDVIVARDKRKEKTAEDPSIVGFASLFAEPSLGKPVARMSNVLFYPGSETWHKEDFLRNLGVLLSQSALDNTKANVIVVDFTNNQQPFVDMNHENGLVSDLKRYTFTVCRPAK